MKHDKDHRQEITYRQGVRHTTCDCDEGYVYSKVDEAHAQELWFENYAEENAYSGE